MENVTPTGVYSDPWTPDHEPEAVDRLVLATWRADQLAAHLAARLEAVGNAFDVEQADSPDTPAALQAELHALGLCAVQIRQFLAEVTRCAGAYV